MIQDAILDAAYAEFKITKIVDKRSEWRLSSRSELVSRTLDAKLFEDKSFRYTYGSNLPHLLSRELNIDVVEVMKRLQARLKSQGGFILDVVVNAERLTFALSASFNQAALCSTSHTYARSALNRGFPCQYGVELMSPIRMTESSRVDFMRPVFTASMLHALLSQQRHKVMTPLSVRLPNVTSLEMAQLVALGLRTKSAAPSSWNDVGVLKKQMNQMDRDSFVSLEPETLRILDLVQRGQTTGTDVGALWDAIERLGFENALTDLSMLAPEILVAPESMALSDAQFLFEQLKSLNLIQKDSQGYWIFSNGHLAPLKLAWNNTLMRPLFDLASLIHYLRDTNVLLPRRIVAVGRSSEREYLLSLNSILDKLDLLKPLAAWIDFVPVASTSYSSAAPADGNSALKVYQDTLSVFPQVVEAIACQTRAAAPRPSPRLGANETASTPSRLHDSFEVNMSKSIDIASRLAVRFHCLLQDRTADAKLTKEGIFGNPRGGFLYILRIFDALKLLLPEDETSAKRDPTETELEQLKRHEDTMRLSQLLLEVPDRFRDAETDSSPRHLAWHLVQLTIAVEKVLIVGKHSKFLESSLRQRLVASSVSAIDRILRALRCDV